ncbi:hypothetical protein [Lichenifustis flavocetrariae]|uniref:Uncharacterized protein n=1 Tax=Lichenifustis flavocetrariae TaxID=2949735 RepID=A0AA41Z5H6_9HYPH|nr:hypothetical protein [Lichenifustis flavocetrariae]MCW6513155.1 hypothetical protein [Lichenifustis flavocetrariae]
MFEQWIDKSDPSVRLVTSQGSSLPADLGPRDWKLLGPIEPPAEIVEKVQTVGFAFFHSDESEPAPGGLNNSNAAGA